tara:strand:+ start:123674 stop:124954 length:1281 start_codon:yes stop_codon:yes gene_type:complete
MRLISLFFPFFLSSIFSMMVNANQGLDTLVQEKMEFLSHSSEIATTYCTNEDGVFDDETLTNTYAKFDGVNETSCYSFLKKISEIEDEYEELIKEKAQRENLVYIPERFCSQEESLSEVDSLNSNLLAVDDNLQGCENRNGIASCAGKLTCNAVESMATIGTFGIYPYLEDLMGSEISSCSGNTKGNCGATFFKGVADNLVGTWEAVKGGWGWLKKAPGRLLDWSSEKVSEATDYFTSFDSFSSMKMHMMSSLSDADLAGWVKDKAKGIANIFTKVLEGVKGAFKNALVNNYGCQKWSGSKCIEPLNIDCMNCNDYVNSFCGFLGAAAPELVALYLSGGTSALMKFGANLSSKASKSLSFAVQYAKKSRWTTATKNLFSLTGQRLSKMKSALRGYTKKQSHIIRKVDLPDKKTTHSRKVCRWKGRK